MSSQQLLLGAGGVPKKTYIDDVWRCMPYRGNGSSTTRTIKGPKMSDGGLTIFKRRDGSGDGWRVLNTVRGNTKLMYTHSSSQENNVNGGQYGGLGWTNSGVNIATTDSALNTNGGEYACYNWKKEKNFFDIVEYEGNGSTTTGGSARAIAHNLGATPGMIWIKNCDDTGHWTVFHRYNDGQPGGSTSGHEDYEMKLDENSIRNSTVHFGNKAPTSTHFYVASDGSPPDDVNEDGDTYIAFIFASHHDNSGTFGIDDNQDICSAGIYMGNGSSDGPTIDLGWIPQHVFIKARAVSSQSWLIFDTMRGMSFDSDKDEYIKYDSHGSRTLAGRLDIENNKDFTGFKITNDSDSVNKNSEEYIYYAIRGHDGKVTPPIEAGSEFLSLKFGSSNTGQSNTSDSPYFPDQPTYESTLTGGSKRIDYAWIKDRTTVSSWYQIGRDISGRRQIFENGTDVEAAHDSSDMDWSFENGFNDGGGAANWMSWGWQKSDCFDMFNYQGAETTNSLKHNLSSAPTLILVQNLSSNVEPLFRWGGNHASDEYITTDNQGEKDNLTPHPWGSAPSSTHVYLGNHQRVNHQNNHYRMCLWCDKAGVQKAGTYVGDGSSDQTITLGFQPRFIMLINENGGCNWRIFDTVRGWGSGVDPQMAFNSKDGGMSPNYNFGAPTSNGFHIDSFDSCHNDNGDKFFYLACA